MLQSSFPPQASNLGLSAVQHCDLVARGGPARQSASRGDAGGGCICTLSRFTPSRAVSLRSTPCA